MCTNTTIKDISIIASTTCFYAYSSKNLAAEFIVRAAIDLINDAANDVYIVDWKTMPTIGLNIIKEVCKEIDDCDVFIGDLTDLNPNVLFELGYAIVTDKRIWITRLSDKKAHQNFFDELNLLSTIGYFEYKNAHEIRDEFWKQAPHHDLLNTLFKNKITPLKSIVREPKLLFLKSPANDQDSDLTSRFFLHSDFQPIIDDLVETKNRSLEWYIDHVLGAFAVIAHFAPQEFELKNARLAFVCGMAFGLGKHLLMVAKEPYDPAFDYAELMYKYSSTQQKNERITDWLKEGTPIYTKLLGRYTRFTNAQQKKQALLEFRNINLGEYEAEAEKDQLEYYFVESESFALALGNASYLIVSGRKGSGKTANFYQLGQTLSKDENKRVCKIKPVAYDLGGVFELYQQKLLGSRKAYIIETLWKFLLYTELAFDVFKSLQSKPTQMYTQHEKELYTFVEKTEYIKEDFTIRLDTIIRQLYSHKIDDEASAKEEREDFSNILHEKIIAHLRILLGHVLGDLSKVYILIDNLDKAWDKSENLPGLAHFLFGLLNVMERVSLDFQTRDSRKQSIPLSLVVFMRSDILSAIRSFREEKDKLHVKVVEWNNAVLLLKIIEERFKNALGEGINSTEVWKNYFPRNVDGIPTRTYLFGQVLPRPRDIIFLCKQAQLNAITQEHTRIEESDIKQALKAYSSYVYERLIEETDSQIPEIKIILRKFLNSQEIVTRQQIATFLKETKIENLPVDLIIDCLIDANFLGYEISTDTFLFVYDQRKEDRQEQAKRITLATGIERYRINPPFHSYFEINQST